MNGTDEMPLGKKYIGKPISEVPADYFQFLYDKGIISVHKWNKVFHYAKDKGLIDLEIKGYKKDG